MILLKNSNKKLVSPLSETASTKSKTTETASFSIEDSKYCPEKNCNMEMKRIKCNGHDALYCPVHRITLAAPNKK